MQLFFHTPFVFGYGCKFVIRLDIIYPVNFLSLNFFSKKNCIFCTRLLLAGCCIVTLYILYKYT